MFLKFLPFMGLLQEMRQRNYSNVVIRNWKIGHWTFYLSGTTRGSEILEPLLELQPQWHDFQGVVFELRTPMWASVFLESTEKGVCESKDTISSAFLKYGKERRNIYCITLN
jgi:hypothetical protein